MTANPALALGEPAPDFRLRGPAGHFVGLSDFRGRQPVVLVFYALAFTPVCSHQLPELERARARIEELGATLLGVSVDSWQANEAFARRLGVLFPLLSDFRREVSRAYGVLDEELFHSERAVFVIDRQGLLVHADVSPDWEDPAQIPILTRVLERLESLSR